MVVFCKLSFSKLNIILYRFYHRNEKIRAIVIDGGVAATAAATAGIFQALSIRNSDHNSLTTLVTEDRQEIFEAYQPQADFEKGQINARIKTHDSYTRGISNNKYSSIVHLFPSDCLERMLKEKGVTVSRVFKFSYILILK